MQTGKAWATWPSSDEDRAYLYVPPGRQGWGTRKMAQPSTPVEGPVRVENCQDADRTLHVRPASLSCASGLPLRQSRASCIIY